MRTLPRIMPQPSPSRRWPRARARHRPHKSAPADATFTYLNNLDVMTEWDPATSYSNEGIAMSNMYEQLTRTDPETGDVEPLLAESWESSADGLEWTFHLRPDVTFSTGNPVDAAAAKAAIERTIELKGGASYIWGPVKSISAKDDTTLVFDLKYATPLDLVASSGFGAYIYDTKATDGDLAKWFNEGNAAGTGPYVADLVEEGHRDRADARAEQGLLGRLGRRALHVARLQGRSRADHGESSSSRAATAPSSRSCRRRSSPRSRTTKRHQDRREPVVPERDRDAEHRLGTACRRQAPAGGRRGHRLRRHHHHARGQHGQGDRSRARGLLGYTDEVQPTTDEAAARQLLDEAGYSEANI